MPLYVCWESVEGRAFSPRHSMLFMSRVSLNLELSDSTSLLRIPVPSAVGLQAAARPAQLFMWVTGSHAALPMFAR